MGLILLGLFSCDENKDIGLDLQGGETLSTFFTDTITINSSVTIADSVNTTNTSTILVGSVEDARFGTTSAEAYSQLSMGIITDLDFGEGAVFDSITMLLSYPYVYGDTVTPQTYFIHEITEAIDTIAYYSFDKIEETGIGDELGSFTLAPADNSLNFVSFRLSDQFGQKIFDKSGQTELSSQENFANFFKGLRLSTLNSSGNTMLGFNPSNTQSFVTIHFQGPSGDTLAPRTFSFSFGRGYNNITPNLENSSTLADVARGMKVSTTATNNECYLQAGTGITTLLEFPYLKNLGNGKQVIISRAELVFRPIDALNEDETKLPPESIYLKVASEDQTFSEGFINSELSTTNPVISEYNSSGRAYPAMRITSYIQNVIEGNTPNYGVFLGISPAIDRERVNQVVIGDANHPTASQIQLQVYYTVID